MPHAPLQLFCRFCYRNFPSDRSRRRHESATHNSDVDANKLKNSAPESHLFRRCNLCMIYTSSTEAAVTSHAGSEHHKRAVLAVNLSSIKAGLGIPRHVRRSPKVQARARAASNFRLHGMQAPLRTQAVLKVDNRNAAPRSGPRGGRNHAWKRREVVAGRRESVPISCVGMMAVKCTAIAWYF